MDSADSNRRSRPIAGLPLDGLRDGEAITKRWLLELIGAASLRDAGAVPAAELARSGPQLSALCVAALESDDALGELERSAYSALAGTLSGASDAAGVAASTAALQAAMWDAVLGTLPGPRADLVASVSERATEIASVVLRRSLASAGAATGVSAPPAAQTSVADTSPPPVAIAEPQPTGEITVSKPSDEPWLDAIEERLTEAGEQQQFAIFTVELDEVDRMVASASGKDVAAAIDSAERALTDVLTTDDAMLREHVGRYWIVAGATEREAARSLGSELAACVSHAASIAGVPLTASVGLALAPEDGDDAASLAAHADEGLFAARAAGIRIA